jgi:hypothetical protein
MSDNPGYNNATVRIELPEHIESEETKYEKPFEERSTGNPYT